MRHILSLLRKADEDYKMIQDGDHVFVGLSGGKDSVVLLTALAQYRKFKDKNFTLSAVMIDTGFNLDLEAVKRLKKHCEDIDVPLYIEKTDIAEIVFDVRKETNPCALCAKMRRGALNNKINELGGGKLALGHNADDVVGTFLLSLVYEGRLNCFDPVSHMDRSNITMIRPLIYMEEREIKQAVSNYNLPIVENPCPNNHHSQREEMKEVLKDLSKYNKDMKQQIMRAIFHPERNHLWNKPE